MGKKTSKTKKDSPRGESTKVWGIADVDDFIKVPRAFLYLRRYLIDKSLSWFKPRHQLLLLSLASRKFQNKQIRAYWEELAIDLGVSRNTVRKSAYELRKHGFIKIGQHRGRDPENDRPGFRNERNSFDLSPFVKKIEEAYRIRKQDRKRGKDSDGEAA